MIIMQYRFTLPAQFNMSTIHQRIEQNAYKLNGFPNLGFKAYMLQEQGNDDIYQQDNCYAPFYFWNSSEGMKAFLVSGGYSHLEQDFSRPEICTYLPFVHKQHNNLCDTQYAWVIKERISRSTSIQILLEQQQTRATQFTHPDITAYVIALDTQTWHLSTWLFFRANVKLQALPQFKLNDEVEFNTYQVGYVAE